MPALLVPRTKPRLRSQFWQYVQRIEVKTDKITKADGTVLPAQTLMARFITNSIDLITNEFHEYYVLLARLGDPECFMDLLETPAGYIDCIISRSCSAKVDIYFDGERLSGFDAVSGPGPHPGQFAFRVFTP